MGTGMTDLTEFETRINNATSAIDELAVSRGDTLPNLMDTYSYTEIPEIDEIMERNNLNGTESTIDEIIACYDAR